tara:strand:+ start:42 stop:380 length:339 start_codon:yes stop_codon:yes gene_type:complete
MKKCLVCDNTFYPKNMYHKYCSKECGRKKWSETYVSPVAKGEMFQESVKKKWNIGEELICKECDKKFIKKYVSQKYCSTDCRGIYNKRIIDARDAEKKKQQEIENKYYGRTD